MIRRFFLPSLPLVFWLSAVAVAQDDFSELFERSSPSVVTLVSYDADGIRRQLGSGFVVADEVIATSLHVVENAAIVEVHAPGDDGVLYAQSILKADEDWDLALLGIDDLNASPLPLADDADVRVGMTIVAIGSPLGLENTLSTGIISGRRQRGPFDDLLQFTSAISVGSSGGPVLNNAGEVVGVTTLTTAAGQNVNFAVPGREVARLLETVKRRNPEVVLVSKASKVEEILNRPQLVRSEIEEQCSGEDVEYLSSTIDGAIRVGGRLYNADAVMTANLGVPGVLACYMIYEGASYKLIEEIGERCPTATRVLESAVQEAQLDSVPVSEKAWLIRYAFDTLLGHPTVRGLPPIPRD